MHFEIYPSVRDHAIQYILLFLSARAQTNSTCVVHKENVLLFRNSIHVLTELGAYKASSPTNVLVLCVRFHELYSTGVSLDAKPTLIQVLNHLFARSLSIVEAVDGLFQFHKQHVLCISLLLSVCLHVIIHVSLDDSLTHLLINRGATIKEWNVTIFVHGEVLERFSGHL